LISAGVPPQTPLEELTVIPQAEAPGWIWGRITAGEGLGWGTGGKGRGEGAGGGKWRGGKWRAPKLLLTQGPSEPCYATASEQWSNYRATDDDGPC